MQADVAIACDMVAANAPDAIGALRHAHTRTVINTHVAPLVNFTRDPDAAFRPEALLAKIRHALGPAESATLDAHGMATALFGDSILANILMLGYAWQLGWVPVSLPALQRAIELNGVAPQANRLALDAGRLAAHAPDTMRDAVRPAAQVVQLTIPESFEQAVRRREQDLIAYQDAAYANRFRCFVDQVAQQERALDPAPRRSLPLALAVARSLYQLMAYKDEYEVARLYTDGNFQAQLQDAFEGDFSLRFHMAPPLFSRKDPSTGRPRKITLGPRTMTLLKWLARLKGVRGSKLDVFGYLPERRTERALIDEYMAAMLGICKDLDAARLPQAIAIAALPQRVRGYGPIKMRAIEEYRGRLSAALQTYAAPSSQPLSPRKTA
jgi:indolepyruvate ferredoxin oxidoreductase